MRPTLCLAAVLLFFLGAISAQTSPSHSNSPQKDRAVQVSVRIPTAPTAFRGDGLWHLCYEIDLVNFSPTALSLQRIEVASESGTSLLSVEGEKLDRMLFHPARPVDTNLASATEISPGETVIAYMWVDVPKDSSIPVRLQHTLMVKKGADGSVAELDAPQTNVLSGLPEIASPLQGKNWVAGSAPSNSSPHRRALIVVDGTPHIGQRYAIDWVQIGADGKSFAGDSKDNHSYHCFGLEAHAIADATVVGVKDGIPENVPNEKPVVPITLDTVAGNHVNLDLGGGVYAMYAHLQPGSIRVKVGDRVTLGQVVGLVGNTGNSSEPHLHFQLMNANSPLGSEGLPYQLASYQLVGKAAEELRSVTLLPATRDHHGEMPLENEIVNFER